jgi:hypothetical protein
MLIKHRTATLLFVILESFLVAGNIASGQEYVRQLRTPARVHGLIGGESHHSYVVRARMGQTMTVQISWRREHDDELGDNHAEFFVGELPDFDGDGCVKFGVESDDGTSWTGRIPKTGNYYIYVNAHPWARYTLRITVR